MQRERTNVHFRIPREPVVSSNLAAVGYCAETGELDVEFTSGEAWRYYHVSHDTHAALVAAGSVGRYYIANIKGAYNGVPLDRVTGEPKTPQPGPDGQPERVQDREP
jgi:KTSC domain